MSQAGNILRRSSDFFAIHYKQFAQDLNADDIDPQNPPFIEVVLECCGYGYFDEYKRQMTKNFLAYLRATVKTYKKLKTLKTLKIVFNGFSVDHEQIEEICFYILQIIQKQKETFKTLWIHTTNLRLCKLRYISCLFMIIDKFGLQNNTEEISIQMSDWEFQEGYPSYRELFKIFQDFGSNIPQSLGFSYRKFRLELSSWYTREKEAYLFLKDAVNPNFIKQRLESSNQDQIYQNQHNRITSLSKMRQQEKQPASKVIEDFLKSLDTVYLFPQFPNKKRFPSQYQKSKQTYNSSLKSLKQNEAIVGSTLFKFPIQFINRLRSQEFHNQMLRVIVELIGNMPNAEDVSIDLRGWNPMFSLSSLKKKLDTQVSTKQQYSIIRKGYKLTKKMPINVHNQDEDQVNGLLNEREKQKTLKTAYIM